MFKTFRLLILAAAMATGFHSWADLPRSSTLVQTRQGLVRGYIDSSEVTAFKGIPYAAPPTGELRWRNPQPAIPHAGTLPANAFGKICPQIGDDGSYLGDEDCLTLNIWSPSTQPSHLFPVMLYLHGGANQNGSSADTGLGQDNYDGSAISKLGQVVVVTINYRLGLFGFIAHPSLDDEQGESGNYGIRDQIAALQWVQRNISGFGGDPSKVMLFGQSAGASDSLILLTLPAAKGLFSRAAFHSGDSGLLSKKSDVEALGDLMIQRLGGDPHGDPKAVAKLIRSKSVTDLLAATGATSYPGGADALWPEPVLDGSLIPDQPLLALKAGKHNAMPLLVSTTSEEMRTAMYVITPNPIATENDYDQLVSSSFGTVAAPFILNEYPVASYPTPFDDAVATFSDFIQNSAARNVARAAFQGQSEPIWRFIFDYRYASGPLATYGAGHWIDTTILFQTFHWTGYTPTAQDMSASNAMIAAWARFAYTGDPGSVSGVAWPRYDLESDPYLMFGAATKSGAGYRAQQCDFWEGLTCAAAQRSAFHKECATSTYLQ